MTQPGTKGIALRRSTRGGLCNGCCDEGDGNGFVGPVCGAPYQVGNVDPLECGPPVVTLERGQEILYRATVTASGTATSSRRNIVPSGNGDVVYNGSAAATYNYQASVEVLWRPCSDGIVTPEFVSWQASGQYRTETVRQTGGGNTAIVVRTETVTGSNPSNPGQIPQRCPFTRAYRNAGPDFSSGGVPIVNPIIDVTTTPTVGFETLTSATVVEQQAQPDPGVFCGPATKDIDETVDFGNAIETTRERVQTNVTYDVFRCENVISGNYFNRLDSTVLDEFSQQESQISARLVVELLGIRLAGGALANPRTRFGTIPADYNPNDPTNFRSCCDPA